jgi:NAD(P) transhydrogenase subunit alpha
MSDPMVWLIFFVLAVFVGIETISKVSSTLHTPLMSGANAIHGVILIGAVIAAGTATTTPVLILALVAVVLASINLAGGFVVTDRMLRMFAGRKQLPGPSTGSGRKDIES